MDDFKQVLENLRDNHQRHLDNLVKWKELGGHLENYPEHETIDDFIQREQKAIDGLQKAIGMLK